MPAGCRWSSVEVCAVTVAGEAGDVGFLHAVDSLAPPPGKRLAVAPPLQLAALAPPPYPAAPPRDERPLHLLLRPPMTEPFVSSCGPSVSAPCVPPPLPV